MEFFAGAGREIGLEKGGREGRDGTTREWSMCKRGGGVGLTITYCTG